jgi:hypothetical protein
MALQHAALAGVPRPALVLGLMGLIPFGGLAIADALDPASPVWTQALHAYAATILSFLGGVRWGLAMRDGAPVLRDLAVSVIPQLAGWIALLLPPATAAGVLSVALALLWSADRRLARAGSAPPWYGALRTPLTAGAVASILFAALL